MSKAVTVNQLLKNLEELKKKGYGNAQIFVTEGLFKDSRKTM